MNVPQLILGTSGLTFPGNHFGWKSAGIELSTSTDTERRVLLVGPALR